MSCQRILSAGVDDDSVAVDSILIVSFGGPESPDDVMPFLRNVTRGRNVPEERLQEVAEHYMHFGGKSPINDQARELIEALRRVLDEQGPQLPIYWGNRNWHPYLADTLQQMKTDGRRHAVAFVTSAYSSYSSCRQYREDIAGAQEAVGDGAPVVDKVRQFYNHPGFIEPMVHNVQAAIDRLPGDVRNDAHLAFTAHSIPLAMAQNSRYVEQLTEAARLVVDRLEGARRWELVFQSRSGSPIVPWLEPDIGDHLMAVAKDGAPAVVMVPIGFISDHLEVLFDLDTEASEIAADRQLPVSRAATVGTDPQFVQAVRDLIAEAVDGSIEPEALGDHGVIGCLGTGCCLPR